MSRARVGVRRVMREGGRNKERRGMGRRDGGAREGGEKSGRATGRIRGPQCHLYVPIPEPNRFYENWQELHFCSEAYPAGVLLWRTETAKWQAKLRAHQCGL